MKLDITKVLIILWFIWNCPALFGQFQPELYDKLKTEYPEDNIVYLLKEITLKIDMKNDQLDIRKLENNQIMYLRNASTFNYGQTVYSSGFMEFTDFTANSYMLENNKYKKIKVKDYTIKDGYFDDVFFDDTKELDFSFPGISNGSIVELNTEHQITDPRFLNSIFIKEGMPIEQFKLRIEVNDGVELSTIEKNLENTKLEFQKSAEKGKTVYSWIGNKLDELKFERRQPGLRYFAPHIIPIIQKSKKGSEEKVYHKKVDELYAYYYNFIKDISEDIDTTDLYKIMTEVTEGCTTELEKVRAIYYWTQQNIKYIAFEDGMGGFIPRKPDEVCRKRYGDCKDNSALMYELLKLAGIKSHLTWIGTRSLPYSYSEVPTLQADNHMILTYIDGNKTYFLDATGRFLQPEFPSGFIQEKEALIAIDRDNFIIRKVPKVNAERNMLIDKANMKFSDGKLAGSGSFELSGFPKINFQYRLEGEEEKDLKEGIENRLEKGNNTFKLTTYPELDLASYDSVIHMDYSFEIGSYLQTIDNEMYLNMNLKRPWISIKIEDDRESPIEFSNTSLQLMEYSFEIPDGYKVDYLPETIEYTDGEYSFKTSYTVAENQIKYTHKVRMNDLLIEADEFASWKSFTTALAKSYNESVVLKKQ